MVFIKEEINENVRQAAGTIIAASVKKIVNLFIILSFQMGRVFGNT